MTKGSRIKKARTDANLSQVELAGKIGVSKQTLYKYENDIITNIPSDKIYEIASICGTTPEYLMGWSGGEETSDGYYYDEETAKLAQEIYQNPELHMLFDATRDASASDLKAFYDMVLLMKRRERHED